MAVALLYPNLHTCEHTLQTPPAATSPPSSPAPAAMPTPPSPAASTSASPLIVCTVSPTPVLVTQCEFLPLRNPGTIAADAVRFVCTVCGFEVSRASTSITTAIVVIGILGSTTTLYRKLDVAKAIAAETTATEKLLPWIRLLDQFEFVVFVTGWHCGGVAIDRRQLVSAITVRCLAFQPCVLTECAELELCSIILMIIASNSRPHPGVAAPFLCTSTFHCENDSSANVRCDDCLTFAADFEESTVAFTAHIRPVCSAGRRATHGLPVFADTDVVGTGGSPCASSPLSTPTGGTMCRIDGGGILPNAARLAASMPTILLLFASCACLASDLSPLVLVLAGSALSAPVSSLRGRRAFVSVFS